ncbi:hypothetical protein F4824DRAFT_503580 [Ustulina deusta]|nr:hypothetical protein F4824DRAFT_503580 [Ustulina deusta]
MDRLRHRANTNAMSTKSHVISTLDKELQSCFFTSIGLEYYKGTWVSTPELKPVVSYLPADSKLAQWARLGATPDENWTGSRKFLPTDSEKKKRSLEITEILFELKNAYFKLFQEKSDELKTLADLYERFPRFLKVANAPELPTSECLRLFKVALKKGDVLGTEKKLPPQLKAHFDRAIDGLDFIYCQTPEKRLKRTYGDGGENAAFALADPLDYQLFVEHESPRIVAHQVYADLKECRTHSTSKLPSPLALYMPPWPTPKAVVVAQFLAPYWDCNHELLQLRYESKISEICRFLKGTPARIVPEDGGSIVADEIARGDTDNSPEEMLGGSMTEI